MDWRRRCREALASCALVDRQRLGQQAAHHALEGLLGRGYRRVVLYAPMPREIDTTDLAAALQNAGCEVLYPRVVGPTLELARPGWGLRPGAYGIAEPSGEAVPLEHIDAVVVPGVGFDERGVRLGSGRGYYDRALASYSGAKIGLALACQVLPELPCEPHDVRVHVIVTEHGWQPVTGACP